jgi:hypothetical protein
MHKAIGSILTTTKKKERKLNENKQTTKKNPVWNPTELKERRPAS